MHITEQHTTQPLTCGHIWHLAWHLVQICAYRYRNQNLDQYAFELYLHIRVSPGIGAPTGAQNSRCAVTVCIMAAWPAPDAVGAVYTAADNGAGAVAMELLDESDAVAMELLDECEWLSRNSADDVALSDSPDAPGMIYDTTFVPVDLPDLANEGGGAGELDGIEPELLLLPLSGMVSNSVSVVANEGDSAGDLDDIEPELLPLAGSDTGVICANEYDGDCDDDGELDDGAGESDDDGETYDRSSQSQISRTEMFDGGPEVGDDVWLINSPGAASVNAALLGESSSPITLPDAGMLSTK